MSDVSDDDFANNYGPTTPAPPKKARGARVGGKPVAGPSTKPQSKSTAAKKPANRAGSTIELDDDEDQDVMMVDEQPAKKRRKDPSEESEEVVAVPGPPRAVAKKSVARSEPPPNGTSKAKGKARADPPAKGSKVNGTAVEAEEDNAEVVELDEDEPPDPLPQKPVRAGSKQPKLKNGTHTPATTRPSKAEEKLARELESLRAQLERSRESAKEVRYDLSRTPNLRCNRTVKITTQRDKLAKQLEDVFRIRHTEPEQALEEYKSHFDDSMKRKESLIEELTAQLSKLQSSSKSGGKSQTTLHFLTREAAEEEKQALREENVRLKEVIKQRDATIASKDKQIQTLQDEAKIIQKELDAEIERSKALAARAPAPQVTRQQKPTPSESRNTPVIRLYEDMTNILVTGTKVEKNAHYPDLDEDVLTCIYTYQNPEEGSAFSLNFSLRNTYEYPEGIDSGTHIPKDQLVMKVRYEPKDLDKEPQDIVERLSFFKDPFMFARDQMTVFLKTLTDTIAAIFEPDAEGDGSGVHDDPEVIIVEG
ncbi:hypothetical protein ONZ51_g443 [Trametes cubensis]|uniref:Monopolin complex subunit Csm1/Pcs1 C-terminal domain-containing protein n=1 Tax=Trametes cubensis TaxID=1111947 RepID=A0AAD7U3Z6_9APHY|nr:hypothetical protein ONZ51_g443 [Trametes cubensis]